MCVRLWRVRYFHLLVYFGWLLLVVLLLFLFIFSSVCACVSFHLYWCGHGLSITCHHMHTHTHTYCLSGTHWLSLFGFFYSFDRDRCFHICVNATSVHLYCRRCCCYCYCCCRCRCRLSTSYVRLLVRSYGARTIRFDGKNAHTYWQTYLVFWIAFHSPLTPSTW